MRGWNHEQIKETPPTVNKQRSNLQVTDKGVLTFVPESVGWLHPGSKNVLVLQVSHEACFHSCVKAGKLRPNIWPILESSDKYTEKRGCPHHRRGDGDVRMNYIWILTSGAYCCLVEGPPGGERRTSRMVFWAPSESSGSLHSRTLFNEWTLGRL